MLKWKCNSCIYKSKLVNYGLKLHFFTGSLGSMLKSSIFTIQLYYVKPFLQFAYLNADLLSLVINLYLNKQIVIKAIHNPIVKSVMLLSAIKDNNQQCNFLDELDKTIKATFWKILFASNLKSESNSSWKRYSCCFVSNLHVFFV